MQQLEQWPLSRLVEYARNPRKNDHAVDAVAAAIREFGFRVPILAKGDGTIIDGHLRFKAAVKLGLDLVPVLRGDDMTETQIKAFRLSVNKLAELADWDDALLALELAELQEAGFDLALTGFDAEELDALLTGETAPKDGLTDEDAVPEVLAEAISQPGDLWLLGEHKLLCGDATRAEDYAVLLGDELADMAFTDPPYNVDYANSPKDKQRGKHRPIANDNLGQDFGVFLTAACRNILGLTKGAIYIAMSSSELDTLQSAFRSAGGKWSTFVIWAKNTFTLGRADYQRQYEPILYGWREGADHYWCGDRDQGDVWQIKKPQKNDLHPTMKPVELVERAVRNSSKTRDIVLDAFGGSGTTLIACEKTGRRARLIELDARYCDVITRRWQDWTGQKAQRASDGALFDTLAGATQ